MGVVSLDTLSFDIVLRILCYLSAYDIVRTCQVGQYPALASDRTALMAHADVQIPGSYSGGTLRLARVGREILFREFLGRAPHSTPHCTFNRRAACVRRGTSQARSILGRRDCTHGPPTSLQVLGIEPASILWITTRGGILDHRPRGCRCLAPFSCGFG
jgi:hypothetical protein